MGKNIALFIDGTGNNGPRDQTTKTASNVYKLHQTCLDKKLYLRGVGSGRFDVLGGMAGFGTKTRLRNAYRFVTHSYEVGDNIFIFGFSRGALAARLFAGFLGYVGTIFGKPPFEDYLPHMYQIYENSVVLDVVKSFEGYLERLGERIKPLPIHFLGVWDTVERYYPRRDLPEIETLAPHITHARHALAIHERRIEMEPTLLRKWDRSRQTVEQVWFPGAHSDVGGGYSDFGLANDSLAWMCSEAKQQGLKFGASVPATIPLILHQQRTRNSVIGSALAKLIGEGIRKDLCSPDQNVITSMGFSKIAQRHLGNDPIPEKDIRFNNYRKKDQRAAIDQLKIADNHARKLLNKIKGPSGGKPAA